jgi:2-dehydropantoate 2-reductase
MRVTVVGAGAIGGTVGVRLHAAGHEVTLVDRDAAHVAAINRDGYRITGIVDLHEHVPAITADDLPAHVAGHGPLGTVILAVKAMDTAAAAEMIRPLLAPDGVVVSYQNGLNEPVIAGIVGPDRTVGAFIHFGADMVGAGEVVLANRLPSYISELDGCESPRIHELADLLGAVTEVRVTGNLDGFLWGKLGYAALAFVVSSVDAPIDEVVARPDARLAIRAVVAEVLDVARAQGFAVEETHGFDSRWFDRDSPTMLADTDAFFDRWVTEYRTAIKRHMGIHRDIRWKKRRTEVDFQVGPVVERGRQFGVPTPACALLVDLIHEVETGRRPQDWSTIDALAAAVG